MYPTHTTHTDNILHDLHKIWFNRKQAARHTPNEQPKQCISEDYYVDDDDDNGEWGLRNVCLLFGLYISHNNMDDICASCSI